MNPIDRVLNGITMYRLTLYYLLALLAAAIVFGFFALLPFTPVAILFSALLITFSCLLINKLCAFLFSAPTNVESTYITALILALIVSPVSPLNMLGVFYLVLLSAIAITSKYLLTLNKSPIFNPAALAVVVMGLVFGQGASWWVGGNVPLLPFVLIGGLLLLRKMQRFDLVCTFTIAALLSVWITAPSYNLLDLLQKVFVGSPLLFLGFVMLTEPITTPSRRPIRLGYGALVGALFAPAIHIGSLYSTPELALIVGNFFSSFINPKGRMILTLNAIERTSQSSSDFVFSSDRMLTFRPGQYMEWTFPHEKPDSRGNRRYFTIASSPTESNIRLGVKFTEPASSFKDALAAMRPGQSLSALRVGGDFTLPSNPKRKLVFIAGGIGITPFRSMITYLLGKREKRDIVLFYSNRTRGDIAYKEIFDKARVVLGLRVMYAITDEAPIEGFHTGMITKELIAREVPDYSERIFYISGPNSMVEGFKKTLADLGIPGRHIKTDFFPGFA